MHEKFENLANKILEQKSAKFTEANKENIKSLLEPLDKDIRNFRKKVEDIHEKDVSQHASLKEFLVNLQQAQAKLSEDARNLTTALKGDSKKQGDWGEFILERTLEASGLVKGLEFSMQESFDRQRPDAIIRLPKIGPSWWTQYPSPLMSDQLGQTMRPLKNRHSRNICNPQKTCG